MKNIKLFIGLLLISSVMFIACVEDDSQYQFTIDDEYPMSTYIGMQPEYSLWKDVMTKANLFSSFNVAGTVKYTMLVPVNESLNKLFETKPFSEWTDEECYELVYNHSFSKEMPRGSIREGSLDELTLSGKFVSSQFAQGDGVQSVILNQNVILEGLPFEALNGYVYGVRGVLTNLEKDVAGILEESGDCQFFYKALVETGIKAQMDKRETTLWNGEVVKLVWTVFAVSDLIYKLDFATYDEFKEHYTRNDLPNIQNDLTNSENGLFKHISQHIIDEEVYTNAMMAMTEDWGGSGADLLKPTVNHYACLGNTKCLQTAEIGGIPTVNPNEDKTDFTVILRDKSNVIASNGCVHYVNRAVDGVTNPFWEQLQTIFDDVRLTDSIETWRAGGWIPAPVQVWEEIKNGVIAEWRWESSPESVNMKYTAVGSGWYGGQSIIAFDLGGVNRGWVEFVTAPVPAGEYNLGQLLYLHTPGAAGTWNVYLNGVFSCTMVYNNPGGSGFGFGGTYSGPVVLDRGGRHTIRYEYEGGRGHLSMGHVSFYPVKP